MRKHGNHFEHQRTSARVGLSFALLGMLCLVAIMWLVASGGTPLAHADPIEPPEGYPKLSLSVKTVTPTLATTAGAILHYAIEIRNTGAYTATDTTLTDFIPENTTYNGDAQASVVPPPIYANGLLTWEGEVGFDNSVVVSFSVAVSPGLAGLVQNTAVLSHPLIAEPVVVTATTVLTDRPVLTIDKSAVPAVPGANKPLTYTLIVVNEGQPAVNLPITVTDRVPLSTTLHGVGADGVASPGGEVITWTRRVTLETGASTLLTFSVDVGDVASGTVITNEHYLVTSPETVLAAGKPYTVTVVDPILFISKELRPDPPGSNRELTYTLKLLNTGSLATNLVVTDRVPAGVEYLRGGSIADGVVSWLLPRLDTGESTELAFTVYVSDVMGITVVNDQYGVCCDEGICEMGEVLTRLVEGPHFEAQAFLDPIAHKPGGGTGTDVYPTLVVHNLGPGNALDAQATLSFYRLQVQAGELYADPAVGTPPPFPAGPDCGDRCSAYVWVGDLGFGETVTFTTDTGQSTVGGNEGTVYSSTVLIADDLSNMSAMPAKDTASGLVTHYANVVPTKSGPTVVGIGELLTYTIEVVNRAMTTDLPPVLTDVVPLNTTFVSASDGGMSLTVSDTVIVSWTLPLLSPGDGVERSFTVRVGDQVISGTQVVNDDYEVLGYGNVMTDAVTSGPPVTTTVLAPGLAGSYKRVTPEMVPVGSGNVLTYYLHIANTGPVDLAGVSVYDLLPWESTTYQRDAIASAGQIISDIVSFHWAGDVAAFSTEVMTFTVLVDPDYFGYITNTATISHSRLAEPVEAVATAFVVASRPILRITKVANPDPVDLGSELAYTLRLRNEGRQATQVVVADAIPSNAAYVPGSATEGGELVGDRVRWVIPVLQPLESRTLAFRVTVESGVRVLNRVYSANSAEGVSTFGIPLWTGIAGVEGGWVYLPIVLRNTP
jgi:uncharacterized repeat protein (TIGR01451 family)